jgi:hypothetical protein
MISGRSMREYATRRRWRIVLQVKEIGSGSSQRESREKLLAAARRREIDFVLVRRLDRWGRSVRYLLATLQELEHLGVGFVSLTETLDLTTPTGGAMAGLLAVFAEFEPAWSMHGGTASAWAGRSPRHSMPTRSGSSIVPASAKPRSPAGFRSAAHLCAAFWLQRGDEMAKKIWLPQEIYQLKVTLLETKPPIWRRLLVPAGLTLEVLHDVLQIAMGWTDSHLHEFRVGQKRFGKPDPEDELMDLPEVSNESTAHLFMVLGKAGAKAIYTYDFGDSWEHAIVVEKVLQPGPGVVYPMCVGGKLLCPPEDCGGIPGYYNLLEAISDPAHKEHEDMLDWLGGSYDPEAFSVDEVNRRLAALQRWWAIT